MQRVAIRAFSVALVLLSATAAVAQQPTSRANDRQSAFMRIYGAAQAPYGFVRFCEANPSSCIVQSADEIRFQATPERLSDLDEVNRSVNRAIKPMTDLELYGVSEYWTLPDTKGDCEDYALMKRQVLMQRGWPASALLMTVVRDEKGDGHAVLTARTAQGDFVLDNKVDDVKLWNKTGYEFVMRQSFINPRIWVSLDPAQATVPSSTVAGVREHR